MRRWLQSIKRWLQRRIRGFDDNETADLHYNIAKFVLPRLRVFKATHQGYPHIPDGYSDKNWVEELEVMIEAFDYIVKDGDDLLHLPVDQFMAESRKRDEIMWLGTQLFGHRFLHLWN